MQSNQRLIPNDQRALGLLSCPSLLVFVPYDGLLCLLLRR